MRGETPAGPRGAAADRRPFDRVWPWAPVAAAVAWGAALGLWGVLRSPGGGAPPPPDAPATWARVAQVGAVMGLMLFLGLLAWRRHGPRAGAGRPALENGLVAFGVPFGAIMGIHQALLHVGGFSFAALAGEAFWWGLASGLTISMPIALWGGAVVGRFLKRRA